MTSNTVIFHISLSSMIMGLFGLVSALRPLPFLPLDPPSFLEDFRRNTPVLPIKYKPVFENIAADVRYPDNPIGVEAGFYIRPRHNGELPFPPFIASRVVPDVIENLRQLEKRIFKPSRANEIPETPGQVKNYEDDLKELEKEKAAELTTISRLEEITATTLPRSSSFVNVGVTRGDKEEYKYNYAL